MVESSAGREARLEEAALPGGEDRKVGQLDDDPGDFDVVRARSRLLTPPPWRANSLAGARTQTSRITIPSSVNSIARNGQPSTFSTPTSTSSKCSGLNVRKDFPGSRFPWEVGEGGVSISLPKSAKGNRPANRGFLRQTPESRRALYGNGTGPPYPKRPSPRVSAGRRNPHGPRASFPGTRDSVRRHDHRPSPRSRIRGRPVSRRVVSGAQKYRPPLPP